MEKIGKCPKCGHALSPRAPQGLCAACLAESLLLEPDESQETIFGSRKSEERRFGDYEILEEIARGGMGVIYRARQIGLQREVALKFVAGLQASPDYLERFQVEAKAAAKLNHPNIVPVYDFGERDGQLFLSMRPLACSLDRRLGRAPLSLESSARLIIKVASAAHFAHQRGIIHRDIKPSNILLDEQEEPYLGDFGLAKLVEKESALTRTRATLGTPSYISPEQAQGAAEVTTATDVYGLGAVLYELLTGHPPFAGGTTLDTVRQVVEKEPRRPSLWNPQIDRDLETICLRCLEKNPEKRYASAEALADDLKRWLRHEPIQARRTRAIERTGKWIRRHPAGALLLAVSIGSLAAISIISTTARNRVAAMGEERRARLARLSLTTADRLIEAGDLSAGLHWQLQAMRLERDQRAIKLARFSVGSVLRANPQVEQMFFHQGPVNLAVFSPDDRYVASASDDGTAVVWDTKTGKATGAPMVHGAPVYFATFNSDGSLLATAADDGTARVWEAASGRPISPAMLCGRNQYRRPQVAPVQFSRDGTRLLTRVGTGAQLWNARSGERIHASFESEGEVTQASLSPDERLIVTASRDGTARVWDSTNREKPRLVLRHKSELEGAWFSPDGERVATIALWDAAHLWDAKTGQEICPPLKHQRDRRISQCVFEPKGTRVLTTGFDNTVRLWDAQDGRLIWENEIDIGVSMASFSGDGELLCVAGFDQIARVFKSSNGKLAWPWMRHSGLLFSAVFGGDGEHLVTAAENGVVEVWKWSSEAAAPIQVRHNGGVHDVATGGNGQKMATAGVNGKTVIWDMSSGQALRSLPYDEAVARVALSADGSTLASVSGAGKVSIWTNQADAPATLAVSNVFAVAMSADQSRLLTVEKSLASGTSAVRMWNLATLRPSAEVLNLPGENVFAGFAGRSGIFVTADREGKIQSWDSETLRPVGKAMSQPGAATEIAFSPDGERMVSAVADRSYSARGAFVWEVKTGTKIAGPLMHRDGVTTVAFSPDGRLVATGGEDGVARVWNAASGAPVTPPLPHHNRLLSVAFSPDSRRLATGGLEGAARMWSAETGAPLTPALQHPDRVVKVAFLQNGERLLAVSADGTGQVWDVSACNDSFEQLSVRAQVLSSQEYDLQEGLVPMSQAGLSNAWSRLKAFK